MLHLNCTVLSTGVYLVCPSRFSCSAVAHGEITMTAIKIRVVGTVPQGKSSPLFLDLFCRSLIILCTFISVVLSSVAVCDGHWLLAGRHVFGLWYFCSLEEKQDSVLGYQGFKASSNCTTHLDEAGVEGLSVGLGMCRFVITLAVVSAIFGLELLVMSQVSEGRDSSRRWTLGTRLVLLAGVMASGGVATFVLLLKAFATLLSFTLTFWCQFTATFLFFLNGMAARHIQHIGLLLPYREHPYAL